MFQDIGTLQISVPPSICSDDPRLCSLRGVGGIHLNEVLQDKNNCIWASLKISKAFYIACAYLTACVGSAVVDSPALGCPLSLTF